MLKGCENIKNLETIIEASKLLFDMIEVFDNLAVAERETLLENKEMDEVAKLQTDIMALRKWKESVHLVYQDALAYESESVDTKSLFDEVEANVSKAKPIAIDTEEELAVTGEDTTPVKDDGVIRVILLNSVYDNIPVAKIIPLVMEVMISKKPFDVVNFPKSEKLNLNKQNFSYDQADIKTKPKKLTNGMYVELDNTFDEVELICHAVMVGCGFREDEIKFE